MVLLVAGPLIGGVLVGYAFGGRLRQLVRTRIRAVWLLWLAAAAQFVQFEFASVRTGVESALGFSLLIPIFGLVAAWLLVNLVDRPRAMRMAVALILLGGGLNAAAIAANGRMPYSPSALVSAQVTADQKARGERSPKHVAADAGTRLLWLGDVLPVRPIKKVVSVGDLILLAGVAALLAAAMRPGGRTRREDDGAGSAGPGHREDDDAGSAGPGHRPDDGTTGYGGEHHGRETDGGDPRSVGRTMDAGAVA
jgi:hypothetical protein